MALITFDGGLKAVPSVWLNGFLLKVLKATEMRFLTVSKYNQHGFI